MGYRTNNVSERFQVASEMDGYRNTIIFHEILIYEVDNTDCYETFDCR